MNDPSGKSLNLENVLDLLLDAVCVVGADDRFIHVSAAFARIFGYRPDEVVGRRLFDFVLPEDRERKRMSLNCSRVTGFGRSYVLGKLGGE